MSAVQVVTKAPKRQTFWQWFRLVHVINEAAADIALYTNDVNMRVTLTRVIIDVSMSMSDGQSGSLGRWDIVMSKDPRGVFTESTASATAQGAVPTTINTCWRHAGAVGAVGGVVDGALSRMSVYRDMDIQRLLYPSDEISWRDQGVVDNDVHLQGYVGLLLKLP